jgi:hypothetical protein
MSSWKITSVSAQLLALLGAVLLVGCAAPEKEELPSIELAEVGAFPLDAHLESKDLAAGTEDFEKVYEAGAKLFYTAFNSLDGVGALKLPDGSDIMRFSALPPGGGARAPISAQSCGGCHNRPDGGGAGLAESNVAADSGMDGLPPFQVRNTTSLLGNGVLQLLAQEITEDLQAIRDEAEKAALGEPGIPLERALESKGIKYGAITATADVDGGVIVDLSKLEGVDPDLVIRPLGVKGNVTTIRNNTVGAAAFLMGMQAEELLWALPYEGEFNPDPDGDGVVRELSVGDITAMVVYGASQEIPQPAQRLAEMGYVEPFSQEDLARVANGETRFNELGCSSCHLPELHLKNTVFEEPTGRGNGNYYNHGLAEKDKNYDPERPFRFDLLEDGQKPKVEAHPDGGAIVRSYGDLKRHHMGRALAAQEEPAPPITANLAPLHHEEQIVLIAPTAFLTPELWGVGSTGPWLHDGRAASLREAVLMHGEDQPLPPGDPGRSEAQESRDAFASLPATQQEELLSFLVSLRSFEAPDDDE